MMKPYREKGMCVRCGKNYWTPHKYEDLEAMSLRFDDGFHMIVSIFKLQGESDCCPRCAKQFYNKCVRAIRGAGLTPEEVYG